MTTRHRMTWALALVLLAWARGAAAQGSDVLILDPSHPEPTFTKFGDQEYETIPTPLKLKDNIFGDAVYFVAGYENATEATDLLVSFQVQGFFADGADAGLQFVINRGNDSLSSLLARTVVKGGVRGIGLQNFGDPRDESSYPVFVAVDWFNPTTLRLRMTAAGDAQIVELNGVPLVPTPTLPGIPGLEHQRTRATPSIEFGTSPNALMTALVTQLRAQPSPLPFYTVTVDPVSGVFGDMATLRAQLTDPDGLPVANKTLTFAASTEPLGSATTDDDGVATIPGFALGLPMFNAGTYRRMIRVSFDDGEAPAPFVGVATLDIARATPVVTWPSPAPIPAGTALSATQLNATADVFGFFTYTPPEGTVMLEGTGQVLSVTFQPNEGINYEPVTTTVLIDVVPPSDLTVTVTSPNGGERILLNVPTAIAWSASGTPTGFDVAVSRDGGATFESLAACTNLPGDVRTCPWTPTGPVTFGLLVRVVARSATTTNADVSDAVAALVVDNVAPVFDPMPDRTVLERTVMNGFPVAHDTPTDTVTFSAIGPVPVGFFMSEFSGIFQWLPTADQGPGSYPITLRATDSGGLFSERTFTITVSDIDPLTPGRLLMDLADPLANFALEGTLPMSPTSTILLISDSGLGSAGRLVANYPRATEATDLVVTFQIGPWTILPGSHALRFVINGGTVTQSALVADVAIQDGQFGIGLAGSSLGRYPVFLPLSVTGRNTLRLRMTAAGDAQIVEVNNTPLVPALTIMPGDQHSWTRPTPGIEISTGLEAVGDALFYLVMAEPAPQPFVVTVDPVSTVFGQTSTLRARLTNAAGAPVAGATLAFAAVTSPLGTAITDADGVATLPDMLLSLPLFHAGSYLRVIRVTVVDGAAAGVVGAGALDIARATPVVTWPSPAPIPAGTALSALQLNATADVFGFFTYTPPEGTVMLAGTGQVLSVTFQPNDALNYEPVTKTVLIDVVSPPDLTVTVTSPNGGERILLNVPTAISWSASGTPTGFDVAVSRDGGLTFDALPACTSLPGDARACPWTPTGLVTFGVLVRVVVRSATTTNADVSDAVAAQVVDNVAPVFEPLPDRTVLERTVLYGQAVVHDTLGDTVTFTAIGAVPSFFDYSTISGFFGWVPRAEQGPGTYPITLRATDSGGLFSEQTFTITVTDLDPTAPGRLVMDPANPFANFTFEGGDTSFLPSPTAVFVSDADPSSSGRLVASYPLASTGTDLVVTFQVRSMTVVDGAPGLEFVINGGDTTHSALVAHVTTSDGQIGIGLQDALGEYPVFVPTSVTSSTTVRLRLTTAGDAQIVELNGVPLVPPATLPGLPGVAHGRTRSAPGIEIATGGIVTADITLVMAEPASPPFVVTVDPVTGAFGSTATLRARLTAADGTPLAGKTLAFQATSVPLGTATTDADGIATMPGFLLGRPQFNAGTYLRAIRVTVLDGEAAGVVGSATLDIVPATPVVTWPTPAPITAGTALSATELNATADVPGFFTYAPPEGTVMAAGTGQVLSVTFQPNDALNYVSVLTTVLIDVVSPLSVTVVTPNGGEKVFVGVPYTIAWSSPGTATSFDVELSRGGGPFTGIPGCVNLHGAERTCTWTPTAPGTTSASVRVIARQPGASETDPSDGVFTISTATPSIRVTAPNTAVAWAVGSTHNVTWSHNLGDGAHVRIELSRDGGPWELVAASAPNTTASSGTFAWEVTGPPAATALVKVSWLDGPTSDVSDAPFAIVPPSLRVVAPNTAVAWDAGSTRTIRVSQNLGPGKDVDLAMSRDDGVSWSPIATITTTDATNAAFDWAVTGPPTTQARVRASLRSNPSVFDLSDVAFTIRPRVTVSTPNKAVTWGAGSTRTVTWKHNLGAGDTVQIEFSPDNGATWMVVASGVPNATATTGTYTGPMPAVQTTTGLLRVSPTAYPADGDVSNAPLTLAPPAVTVTTPNRRVNWVIGSTHDIVWTHNLGTLEQVHLELSRDGGASWEPIRADVANTATTSGRLSWLVTGPSTGNALVRVQWASDVHVRDVSDAPFNIAP